jgi:galactokinase
MHAPPTPPTSPTPPELRSAFAAHFGDPAPTLFVRSPGRINLIGEHIDYNNLSVLPMAIGRHVRLLVRPRADARVRITSLAAGFEPREFVLSGEIPPYPLGDWGNYVKAAVQALARSHEGLHGFDAALDSTLPVAAGLSSSSALVIGVALTLLAANDLGWDPVQLAEAMARAERYTGTQGGGMDQAICAGAVKGTASRVDFAPLRITPVPVPTEWRFVVAHSLTRAEKSGAAQTTYNRRTVECREAVEAVAGFLVARRPAGPPARRLTSYRDLLAAHSASELVAAGRTVLDGDLLKRFRHVVTEADRVRRAEDALRAADLPTFGALLSASHASLRDDYEVSSPALDELVGIAEAAGAAGARLTGAGMGGCIIAAAQVGSVAGVLDRLRAEFYVPRAAPEPLGDHLFLAEPVGGARVATA